MPHTLSRMTQPTISRRALVGKAQKEELRRKRKEEVWKWVWKLFDEHDGLGAGGHICSVSTDTTHANVRFVKKAIRYGWMTCCDVRRLYFDESDSDSDDELECYILTEDFFYGRECVNDKVFLKENKDELKELYALIEGTDDESSSDDESSTE